MAVEVSVGKACGEPVERRVLLTADEVEGASLTHESVKGGIVSVLFAGEGMGVGREGGVFRLAWSQSCRCHKRRNTVQGIVVRAVHLLAAAMCSLCT